MRTFTQNEPLTDAELDRLGDFLKGCKGGKDRDLPLSPTLLETLREYWRWRKPRLYLFPTRTRQHRLDQPISDKTVWIACSDAAQWETPCTSLKVERLQGQRLELDRHRPKTCVRE